MEESWFCEAHRSYVVMHNDCWLSSLLHGLDSVHCCFYSEPHLPAVWMVIVVSFHSVHLCTKMWSVADHRCPCCTLTSWICDSEMTAAKFGFQESGLPGVMLKLSSESMLSDRTFVCLVSWFVVYTWLSFWYPLRPERLHHCGCLYDFSHGCRVGTFETLLFVERWVSNSRSLCASLLS